MNSDLMESRRHPPPLRALSLPLIAQLPREWLIDFEAFGLPPFQFSLAEFVDGVPGLEAIYPGWYGPQSCDTMCIECEDLGNLTLLMDVLLRGAQHIDEEYCPGLVAQLSAWRKTTQQDRQFVALDIEVRLEAMRTALHEGWSVVGYRSSPSCEILEFAARVFASLWGHYSEHPHASEVSDDDPRLVPLFDWHRKWRASKPADLFAQYDEAYARVSEAPTPMNEADFWRIKEKLDQFQWRTVQCNDRPLRDVTTEVLDVIVPTDNQKLFERSGRLIRVTQDMNGHCILEGVSESLMRGHCTRRANFVVTAKGRSRHIDPPISVVRDILSLGVTRFQPLKGITPLPLFRPDGRLITEIGYDAETQILYRPTRHLEVPPIPANPSCSDIIKAKQCLDECLCDFPFVDAASKAMSLGMLVTLFIRQMVHGCIPLFVIDAPQAGTGKSLLLSVIAMIFTGLAAVVTSAPRDEEEWRKRITALLVEGRALVVIDNLVLALDSASLAAVLTSELWEDRILGRTETVRVPNVAAWFVTGNNVKLRGDLPRRSVLCRLDSKMARPWTRNSFRHPDILEWTRAERGRLVWSITVMIKAWIVAGRPRVKVPVIGGFTLWCETVGGILAFHSIEGFLSNLNKIYDDADEESAEWESFLTAWQTIFGDASVTVAMITQALRDGLLLKDFLPEDLDAAWQHPQRSFERCLGRALSRKAEVRFGKLRLVRGANLHNAAIWSVCID